MAGVDVRARRVDIDLRLLARRAAEREESEREERE
jgi:hypothetical protein